MFGHFPRGAIRLCAVIAFAIADCAHGHARYQLDAAQKEGGGEAEAIAGQIPEQFEGSLGPSPSAHPIKEWTFPHARRPNLAVQLGIVGLPNVGKSTLFNTLTKMGIPADNFPFCTIDPNNVSPAAAAAPPSPCHRVRYLVAPPGERLPRAAPRRLV